MNKQYALLTSALVLASMTSLAFAGSEKDIPLPPPPAPSCAWTLGVSALYLQADEIYGSEQDYELGYRLDVAYDNGGLFGYRLTYFDFEGTDDDDIARPDIGVFDFDLTRGFDLGSWQGQYFFGVRYLEFDIPHSTHYDLVFEGWGPTAGVELTRDLGGQWAFYAQARVSWVFGEDKEEDEVDDIAILEAGLGVQYSFGNCDSYIRLGVEAQRYFDFDYYDADSIEDYDIMGAVIRVGFRF